MRSKPFSPTLFDSAEYRVESTPQKRFLKRKNKPVESEIGMQEVVDAVLQKLALMSDAEFAKKLVQYRNDEVSVTLRHIQNECISVPPSSCDVALPTEVAKHAKFNSTP